MHRADSARTLHKAPREGAVPKDVQLHEHQWRGIPCLAHLRQRHDAHRGGHLHCVKIN